MLLYRWFPPITVWTGLSLLAVGDRRGRLGRAMCEPRSTTARSATRAAGCTRSRWRAVGGDRARRRRGWARWCSAGGSACWSICCRAESSLRVAAEDTAGRGGGGRQRAGSGGCRAVAPALLQVAGPGHRPRQRPMATAGVMPRSDGPSDSSAESPKSVDTRSDLRRVQSAHDRSVPRRPRSARRPQAGLGAPDGVAGARHRGQFRAGFHQPGGACSSSPSSWRCGPRWSARSCRCIYRRQSDVDQAKARDLKLVYDLQLDREISARREYELTVETQLRRELATELRAQSSDEVAGAAGRAGRAADQSGDSVRHRPCAPAGDGDAIARPCAATATGTAMARARANESTGSRRCGPKSRFGASTTRSSTCTRSRWSRPRHDSPRRRAISRHTPSSSRRRVCGAPAEPDARATAAPRSGTGCALASSSDTGQPGAWAAPGPPPAPAAERPHEGQSWPPPDRNRQPGGWAPPASTPRPERSEPPPPRRSHRRHAAQPQPEPQPDASTARAAPVRARIPGRRPRKRPARRSSRPGSRSVPRGSGCRPVRPAATGTPARPTARGRPRGRTTTRHHATGLHIARRASANRRRCRRPRRLNGVDGIPAAPPIPRPASPQPTGASQAAGPDPVIPPTTPTPAWTDRRLRRRRCRLLRLRHHRRCRHRRTRSLRCRRRRAPAIAATTSSPRPTSHSQAASRSPTCWHGCKARPSEGGRRRRRED